MEDLLDRLKVYGFHVMQLAAGPYVFGDRYAGSFATALNGIVPLFIGQGKRSVVGTHPEIVERTAESDTVTRLASGYVASIQEEIAPICAMETFECVPRVTLRSVLEEVRARIVGTGLCEWNPPSARQASPLLRAYRMYRDDSSVVLMPRTGEIDGDAPFMDRLRRDVSRLWWELGNAGLKTFCPLLERPGLDLVSLSLGCPAPW